MILRRKIGLPIFLIVLAVSLYHVYYVHFNFRFEEITPGKFYKSGAIPPDKIQYYIEKYNIKTVIDLRSGVLKDALNPESKAQLDAEKSVIDTMAGVRYVNIPSDQIPTEDNLDKFFSILDKEDSYPVLVHCHHGTGRAVIYSALYRIEYENFTNEQARAKTRFLVKGSSFDDHRAKGKYLINYRPRREHRQRVEIQEGMLRR